MQRSTIVLLSSIILSISQITLAADPNVTLQWQSGNTTGSWQLLTANPNTTNTIIFAGPTKTFGNSCYASREMSFQPEVIIDSALKKVQLYIGPGDSMINCLDYWAPTYAYITVEFGPLQKGNWQFEIVAASLFNDPMCSYKNSFTVTDPPKYSGGDGSAQNPWKISNKADLLALGANTADYNDCFVMTNDINLAGDIYSTAIIAKDIPSTTSGYHGVSFKGVFDGSKHVIQNLTINQPGYDYIGLFSEIGFGGQVLNLGLENVNITGNNYVGGLVGFSYAAAITNCYVTGNVTGNEYVGGLIGEGCYISKCYSNCTVMGQKYIGGLAGSGGDMSNCYSTGSANGNETIGGLVGIGGDIFNCYSIAQVSGNYRVGGLVGAIDCEFSNCFWNSEIQTSGITRSIGNYSVTTNVCALTTAQMQQKAIYTTAPANWDFINTWAIGENQTYPYLRQSPASDIDQDSKVDYMDLAILAQNWLSGI